MHLFARTDLGLRPEMSYSIVTDGLAYTAMTIIKLNN